MKKYNHDIIVFSNSIKAYAPKRILEEATKLKLNSIGIEYSNIDIEIEKIILPGAKSIFIRGMGEDTQNSPLKYLLINYYKNNAKILNQKSFESWLSLDKIIQHIEFKKVGIPIAKSYFFGSIKIALQKLPSLEFPLIAKFNAGSKGVSVYKIQKLEDAKKIVQKYDIKTFLFQEFLKSGEDLRVIILGGKVMGAMKRIAQSGQYLTNYSQGGKVEKYDIDKDLKAKKIALAVAKLFKLEYCGVDLMKNGQGNWVVLEVNRACQFEGFEKSTGINVAGKIAEYLVK